MYAYDGIYCGVIIAAGSRRAAAVCRPVSSEVVDNGEDMG